MRVLDRMLERAELSSVRGLSVLDLGCGFGALALVLAARGAQVTALDPNGARLEVGQRVATEFGLGLRWIVDGMETVNLDEQRFDIVLVNNSLCYLVEPTRRKQALERTLKALRPGGLLVIRNPKRFWLRDPFTRLPLLAILPPAAAGAVSRFVGLDRPCVRLLSTRAAMRELRAAGYVSVEHVSNGEPGAVIDRFSYQHLLARRPLR
jgi:ubiquinone/menaquinone biosynthesis C-methylase UbiE